VLSTASAMAFLPSVDLDRSRRFFAQTLGLPLVESTPFACVFRVGATMLRVTKVQELRPQPFTVFGWQVPDVHAAATELASAGITFIHHDGLDQDTNGIWTTPAGDQVAWFHDPDGNTLSLAQLHPA
jgi:catechol 2,3-dioxygenase-like lactoylglutathione lyase family enzyme